MHDRRTEAASWQLAAELVRRHPTWTLTQRFPLDGFYDCLTLSENDRRLIDINRPGSIHLHATTWTPDPDGEEADILTGQQLETTLQQTDGLPRIIQEIERRLGAMPRHPLPASTPQALTCRVIAAILTATIYDKEPHAAQVALPGDVHIEGGNYYATPDEDDPLASAYAEVRSYPRRHVWKLRRGDTPVAYLTQGWAWTANGERFNLPDRRARGATITELATVVLDATRPTRRGRIDRHPTIPTAPVPTTGDVEHISAFALTYNGLTRLSPGPDRSDLWTAIEKTHAHLVATHAVPEGTGTDLARATLFYLQRSAHHSGGVDEEELGLWRTLTDYIHHRSGGRVPLLDDRPSER